MAGSRPAFFEREHMRTLILNASYEPLVVVPTRRAVLLLLSGKASTVAESGLKLHSRSMTVGAPSVVLLNQFIRVPRRTMTLSRKAALDRYGHVCAYCNKYGDTLDHVIPRARGGTHSWENVLVACFKCNNLKADSLLSELGWKLPFELKAPEASAAALITMRWDVPDWDEYTRPWQYQRLQLAG